VPEIDETVLPSLPNVWSRDLGGFRQRWLAGAFGDRERIDDVYGFVVVQDDWGGRAGAPERTILRARVASTIRDGEEIVVRAD
jgi:hypothetical protein